MLLQMIGAETKEINLKSCNILNIKIILIITEKKFQSQLSESVKAKDFKASQEMKVIDCIRVNMVDYFIFNVL